jgi:tetratricopeptide (TPR) repeat protein
MTALRRSVALAPALVSGYSNLAITATAQGDHAQALRYLQVAEHTARQQFAEAMPDWRLAQMAYAYAQLGHREDVIRLADELERQRPPASDVAWAMTYMALGDYVQGLARLAAVIEQRQGAVGGVRQLLGDIAANTYSDPVLEGPGFQEALRALWGGT